MAHILRIEHTAIMHPISGRGVGPYYADPDDEGKSTGVTTQELTQRDRGLQDTVEFFRKKHEGDPNRPNWYQEVWDTKPWVNSVAAFSDWEQLDAWFNCEDRTMLHEVGYMLAVYDVEPKNIRVGSTQLAVLLDVGQTPVQLFPLNLPPALVE